MIHRRGCQLLFIALILGPLIPQGTRAAAPTLQVGIGQVDVTPRQLPVIRNGGFLEASDDRVVDPLHARCLVLDDGKTRLALLVVDSCMLPRELCDRAKQLASERTGIPVERMLISATHTHSAPPLMGALGTDADPEYVAFVRGRLVEAIAGAGGRMKPARVGWATAQAPEQTNCRRWILRPDKMRKDPFGDLTVRAHMHPGYQNPEFVGPAGPEDPELVVFAVQSAEGKPVAVLREEALRARF